MCKDLNSLETSDKLDGILEPIQKAPEAEEITKDLLDVFHTNEKIEDVNEDALETQTLEYAKQEEKLDPIEDAKKTKRKKNFESA